MENADEVDPLPRNAHRLQAVCLARPRAGLVVRTVALPFYRIARKRPAADRIRPLITDHVGRSVFVPHRAAVSRSLRVRAFLHFTTAYTVLSLGTRVRTLFLPDDISLPHT